MPRRKKSSRTVQLKAARAVKWAKREREKALALNPLGTNPESSNQSLTGPDSSSALTTMTAWAQTNGGLPTEAHSNSADPSAPPGKRTRFGSQIEPESDCSSPSQNWMMIHLEILKSMVGDLLCPMCTAEEMTVNIVSKEHQGYATKLRLSCGLCSYKKDVLTSPRSANTDDNYSPYEVNKLMTLFSHKEDGRRKSLKAFSTTFNMPCLNPSTYQKLNKRLSLSSTQGEQKPESSQVSAVNENGSGVQLPETTVPDQVAMGNLV